MERRLMDGDPCLHFPRHSTYPQAQALGVRRIGLKGMILTKPRSDSEKKCLQGVSVESPSINHDLIIGQGDKVGRKVLVRRGLSGIKLSKQPLPQNSHQRPSGFLITHQGG
jgi:hypothetical protein